MSSIAKIITPHVQDLGGFSARRSLPQPQQAMVGPFIFFDHLGPAEFEPGRGVDVRPHPHINLATVTYLFEGSLLHRDSLGTVQEIRPGAINWMTAGKGIVHSERSPDGDRAIQSSLHAIQTWVALPDEAEETDPAFEHYPADELPQWKVDGATITLIAGQALGRESPVRTSSPILYLDIDWTGGGVVAIAPDYSERALYSVTPGLCIDGEAIEEHSLVILKSGETVQVSAEDEARCVVIGGEPVGQRHKWWNLVSSRRDRIEQAQADWQAGRFAAVPGETEKIPLPEEADWIIGGNVLSTPTASEQPAASESLL